ncbi:hypothetical protein L9F63_002971, partial [Diploptera punctata]
LSFLNIYPRTSSSFREKKSVSEGMRKTSVSRCFDSVVYSVSCEFFSPVPGKLFLLLTAMSQW